MGTKPIDTLWRRRVGSWYISHICDLHDFCLPYHSNVACVWLCLLLACWRDDACAVHATMKVKCVLQSFHSVSSLMLVGLVSATEPWTHHIQLERENPVRVSKQQETISIFILQFNKDSKMPLHSTTQQTQQIWTFGFNKIRCFLPSRYVLALFKTTGAGAWETIARRAWVAQGLLVEGFRW